MILSVKDYSPPNVTTRLSKCVWLLFSFLDILMGMFHFVNFIWKHTQPGQWSRNTWFRSLLTKYSQLFLILTQIGKSNGLGNYKLMFKFYHYVVADVILHLSIFKIGNIIQQISILIKLHLKKISIFTVWKCLWWFVISNLPNSMQFSVP